jgi:hypothetical protein
MACPRDEDTMSRPKPPGSDDSAARAFARVGWVKLWPRLHDYAADRLGLAPIDAGEAGVIEAADLVDTLCEAGLAGELGWALRANATDDEVVAYACSKLRGMCSNLRKSAAAADHLGDDALSELQDDAAGALEILLARSVVDEVRRTFSPDAEASAYIARVLEGHERAAIKEQLGWDERHVEVVRRRIVRGLEGLRAERNDNREDRPSGTVLRGDCHDPQTPQERPRTAGEPRRGALRTGRGRRS